MKIEGKLECEFHETQEEQVSRILKDVRLEVEDLEEEAVLRMIDHHFGIVTMMRSVAASVEIVTK